MCVRDEPSEQIEKSIFIVVVFMVYYLIVVCGKGGIHDRQRRNEVYYERGYEKV